MPNDPRSSGRRASVPLAGPFSRRSSAAAQRERRASKKTPMYNPRPDRLSVVLKRRCIVAKFKRNDEAFFHAH